MCCDRLAQSGYRRDKAHPRTEMKRSVTLFSQWCCSDSLSTSRLQRRPDLKSAIGTEGTSVVAVSSTSVGEGHSSLRERIFEELRNRIVRNELPPGTRMVENQLAEELGVPRNPIREEFECWKLQVSYEFFLAEAR